jgi:hypothetical protein
VPNEQPDLKSQESTESELMSEKVMATVLGIVFCITTIIVVWLWK